MKHLSKVERYTRQTILAQVGKEGQQRLSQSRIVVVGAGGIGSAVLPTVVGAGVGHVHVFDKDTVSLSNLPRQFLYDEDDLGLAKTIVAVDKLGRRNRECCVEGGYFEVTDANAVGLFIGSDLIIDASDNLEARLIIDRAAGELEIPWLYASLDGWQGQLTIFGGQAGQYGRYTDFFGIDKSDTNAREGNSLIPVMTSTPAVVGSIAAAECLKFLLGLPCQLTNSFLLVDTLTLGFTHISR